MSLPTTQLFGSIWISQNWLAYLSERNCSFFVRIDEVDDPYEGTIPNFNRRERIPTYMVQNPGLIPEQIEKFSAAFDSYAAELVKSGKVLFNCWHVNQFESAAVWDLYAQRNSGIAIRTNYKHLKDSLDKGTPDLIKFDLIKYIDFENEWMDEDNIYHSA